MRHYNVSFSILQSFLPAFQVPPPRFHHLSLSTQNTHDVPHIATQPIITGAGQALENTQKVKLKRRDVLFVAGNGANGIETCDEFHVLRGRGLLLPLLPPPSPCRRSRASTAPGPDSCTTATPPHSTSTYTVKM